MSIDTRPCKACGRRLSFVKTAEGKIVPLDTVAPVFEVRPGPDGGAIAVRSDQSFGVSHFATCPSANQFSKKGKTK